MAFAVMTQGAFDVAGNGEDILAVVTFPVGCVGHFENVNEWRIISWDGRLWSGS